MKDNANSPVNVLARHLALAFGGVHVPSGVDGEYYETWAVVEVPDLPNQPGTGYRLVLWRKGYGSDEGKTSISMRAPKNLPEGFKEWSTIKWPSASVNGDRDPQAIAADVSRRVVNSVEAKQALDKLNEQVTSYKEMRSGLLTHWEALKALPNVKSGGSYEPEIEATCHKFFNKSGSDYFTGTIYPSGQIHLKDIGNLSFEKAQRILAILAEPKE